MNYEQTKAIELGDIDFFGFLKTIYKYRFTLLVTVAVFVCGGLFVIYVNYQKYQFTQIIRLSTVLSPAGTDPKRIDVYPRRVSVWGDENKAANAFQQMYIPLAYQRYQALHPDIEMNPPVVSSFTAVFRADAAQSAGIYANDKYLVLKAVDKQRFTKDYQQLFKEILVVINAEEMRRNDKIIANNIHYLNALLKQTKQKKPPKDHHVDTYSHKIFQQQLASEIKLLRDFKTTLEPSEFVDTMAMKHTMTKSFAIKTLFVFVFMGILMGLFVIFIISSSKGLSQARDPNE